MKEVLIQIYLFVCQVYNTSEATCFQRTSNNRKTIITDQEIVTIWMFAHLNEKYQKKQMHQFIQEYWGAWFPALPSYQTFVYRLNQLEPTFQTIGAGLQAQLTANLPGEIDMVVDSLPIMLAQQGHSYTAKVARDLADSGYCAAKKTRFHGLRLHVLAQRRAGKLPSPTRSGCALLRITMSPFSKNSFRHCRRPPCLATRPMPTTNYHSPLPRRTHNC